MDNFVFVELECPKCGVEISKRDIWLPIGSARCARCNEHYRIAAIVRRDELLPRSEKPHFSQVQIDPHLDHPTVHIPASGWQMDLWGIALFMGLFFGVGVFQLVKGHHPMVNYLLLLVPVMIMMAFALPSYAHTRVVFGPTITVTWTFMAWSRSKSGMARDLVKISDSVAYEVNEEPVHGIGLFFKNGKKITFGSRLKEEERKWLIRELSEIAHRPTTE